jgi:predicted TIM-barrel fold metal-dependent hydrolase
VIALKFPALKIICGHVGYPWTQEMIAVAWKHANVYIDTSAYLPRYLPPELLQFASTNGRKKVLFGTNFPQLEWDKCMQSTRALVEEGRLRRESLADYLGGNARRLLKLGSIPGPKQKLANL